MAKFIIRARIGPGDTFRKEGEIDAPVKPDGSHFINALRGHLEIMPVIDSRQFLVVYHQTGDAKPFNVRVESVIREG